MAIIFILFTWPFFIIGVLPFLIMNYVSDGYFTEGTVEAGFAAIYCYSALMGFVIVPVITTVAILS